MQTKISSPFLYRILTALTLLAMVWAMVPPMPAYAASITVTTTADDVTTDGNCSLREAIINANADAQTKPDCAGGTGADVITLTSGSTYTLTVAGVLDTNGDLDITDPDGLTIQASGATPAIIDGGDIDRVIDVVDGDFTLNTITVTNGTTTAFSTSGGGIRFAGTGTLNVINSTISDNVGVDIAGCGGGIFNDSAANVNITNSTISNNTCSVSTGDGGGVWKGTSGNLTITNSTISGNSTGDEGGGIRFSGSGTLTITGSTISGNSAGSTSACGGGIHNDSDATIDITSSTISGNTCAGVGSDGGGLWKGFGGTLNITNSTFYGNSTNDNGGGLRITAGTANILFSTFVNNSTTGGGIGNNGGGLQINNATATVTSSIVANNSPHDCEQSGISTVTLTNTLVEADIDCGTESFTSDVGIGTLAGNGGLTQTVAITGSSAAFNAATSCSALITDQRGYPRPQKSTDNCDLGAFELQVNDEPDFTASNPPAVVKNAGAQTLIGWVTSVTLGPPDEATQSVVGYTISGSTCGTLLSAGPSVSAAGTLTYTPAANQVGTCTFDAQVQDDGGTANGGDNLGPKHNFTITVNAASNPLSPSSIDFGDQLFRTSNPPQTVTVANLQGSSITLGTLQGSSSVGTTKVHSKDFFIENDNCSGATLSAGADCTFDVRFLPWSLGAKSGTITVPSDAPDQPYVLSLSGNSIPGTQLLLNRSFDNYAVSTGLPNLWSKSPGFKIGIDGVDSSWAFHGPYSVKLVGDGDLKILSQMVNKSGVPGDDFSFFVTTHADGIPNDADRWLMQVMFYNGSTIVENRNVKLKTGTYEFKRITQTYTATTNYTHIMFRIHFGKSSGTAWVDLSSLQWAP